MPLTQCGIIFLLAKIRPLAYRPSGRQPMNISGHRSRKGCCYRIQRRLSVSFQPECRSVTIRAIVWNSPIASERAYYTILATAGSEHHIGTKIMKLSRWLNRLTVSTDADLTYTYRVSGAALYHPKLKSMQPVLQGRRGETYLQPPHHVLQPLVAASASY